MLEGLTQAVRHLAFIVPAGLGVQEAPWCCSVTPSASAPNWRWAVSAVERLREVLCGLPPLLWWQWLEGRHLQDPVRDPA